MSTQLKRYAVLGAIFSVLGLAIVLKIGEQTGRAQGGKVSAKSQAKLVTQTEVSKDDIIDRYTTLGTLKPSESINIRNELAGRVERIGFEEGANVDKGTTLLKIDDSELRARRYAKQKEYEVSKLKQKRQKNVLEKGGISQLQYELIKSETDVLKAQLQEIHAQIDNTVIRAPFDGIVGVRDVSEGAVISAQTSIAKLHQVDPIELELNLPEKYLARVSKGDQVHFRTRGSETVYDAKVFALSNEVDEGNRTLRVRAKAPNPDKTLRPGQMVAVEIILQRIEDAVTVPTTALLKSRKDNYVFVNENGKAKKQPVEIGIRFDNRIQIKDGLEAGKKVILTGLQDLNDGQKVEIDTSEDAMNAEHIQPDANRRGILKDVFSESSRDLDSDS